MEIKPVTKGVAFRYLRGYAFDPSLSVQMETVEVNNLIYKVEWEHLVGLSGEYIEIIDYDPATGVFYPTVNLTPERPNGLDPSVSNPQFHQQMVYAVIMTTIKNFEKALGRKILWSDHIYEGVDSNGKKKTKSEFVGKLRVYPHALRQANAYYNPLKKSILFGYFPAKPANPALKLPGETVFTCLSHDIIAHETTHAILDGLHRRFVEPTHVDTRAFHEAFADIVALFQHFTFPEVLKHQVGKTRGNLASQNLLGQLALEFGRARGNYGAMRDAIGHTDPVTNKWVPHIPDPNEYQTKLEFHERGAILVAAVFDAFLTIYKQRIQSLLRLATGGTGILPDGELHPDLVDHLSHVASKIAGHVLRMCVRALDYLPPVDVTFGDYLRAIITGDKDLVPDDPRNYRVAFIEAFQKRGIFPKGLKSMSIEVLCHKQFPAMEKFEAVQGIFVDFLREFREKTGYAEGRKGMYNLAKEYITGSPNVKWGLHSRINTKFIKGDGGKRFSEITGLLFLEASKCAKAGFNTSSNGFATYEIGNLWHVNRVTPSGRITNDIVITLLQRRGVIMKQENDEWKVDSYYVPDGVPRPNGFVFRGGCTLIFDLDSTHLKYAIPKRIDDESRMEHQFRYINGLGLNGEVYFQDKTMNALAGPFAFMHTHTDNSEEHGKY